MMAGMNGLVNGKSERKPAVARDLAMVPKTAEGNKPYICKGKARSPWNLVLNLAFSLWSAFH